MRCLRMWKSGRCNVERRAAKVCAPNTTNGLTATMAIPPTDHTIEGCGGMVWAKGLRRKHYQRARRHHRNTSDKPRIVRTCGVEGCSGKAITHGLCNKHYIAEAQWRQLRQTSDNRMHNRRMRRHGPNKRLVRQTLHEGSPPRR